MENYQGSQADIERALSSIDPELLSMARSLGTRIKENYKDDPDKQAQLFAEGMSQAMTRGPSLSGSVTSLDAAKKLNDAAIVAQEMAQAAGLDQEKGLFEKFRDSIRETAIQVAAGDAFIDVDKEEDKKKGQQQNGPHKLVEKARELYGQSQSILAGEMPPGLGDDMGGKPKNLQDAMKIAVTKVAVAVMAGSEAEREYDAGLKDKIDRQNQSEGRGPSMGAQIREAGKQASTQMPDPSDMLEEAGAQGVPSMPSSGLSDMQKNPIGTAFKRMVKNIREELSGKKEEEGKTNNPNPNFVPPEVSEQLNKSAAPLPPEALRGVAAGLQGVASLGREDSFDAKEHHSSATPAVSPPAQQKKQDQGFDFDFYNKKK